MSPLRNIPAIRRLAEEQAQELLVAIRAQRGLMSDHTEGAVIEATLNLLTDLSRPASRDAVARLVATVLKKQAPEKPPHITRECKVYARNVDAWEFVGFVFHDSDALLRYIEKARETAALSPRDLPWDWGKITNARRFVQAVDQGKIRRVVGLTSQVNDREALTIIAFHVLTEPV